MIQFVINQIPYFPFRQLLRQKRFSQVETRLCRACAGYNCNTHRECFSFAQLFTLGIGTFCMYHHIICTVMRHLLFPVMIICSTLYNMSV